MKDDEIRNEFERFLNDYSEYFKSNEEIWYDNLELVKQYIDDNNKKPSSEDKNKDIKKLGLWIRTQQNNYRNNKYIMKNDEIRNEFEKFLNDYFEYLKSNEEIWYDNLKLVKQYIDDNNKRPSTTDKNKNIKKLGIWISHQQQNYKNNKQIMKDEEIRNEFEKFLNDYSEYFKSNEEIWYDNLKLVKQYINDNSKRPSSKDKNKDIKKLGSWFSNQQNNYKNNKEIMKDEEIRNEYEKFLNDYSEYFN